MPHYEGEEQAQKAVDANRSERYRALDLLERYVRTTQYNHRPSFWSDKDGKGKTIPLWERAPCIAYPSTKAAIQSHAGLCFGKGRFPEITAVRSKEDDGDGFTEDEADSLDALLKKLFKQSRFRKTSRSVFRHGQGARSGVAIFGVRGGKLFADTTKAKWCTPTLDPDGRVLSLEIRYVYLDKFKKEGGEWAVRALIYRRVIDDKTDTTYKPAEANDKGDEPKSWTADKDLTFEHKLGFCPVVWYAHMAEASTVDDFDGIAIQEDALDEIEALDFSLSQRHRVALFSEPQVVEIGVKPGTNPTETGRTPVISQPAAPGRGGAIVPGQHEATARYEAGGTGDAARKKGPGYAWQYADENTKVQWLTLGPDATKPLQEDAEDLRMKVAEAMAFVPMDQGSVKFVAQVSGKALLILRAREFDACDEYREDFENEFLLPAVAMLLRISLLRKGDIKLAALGKATQSVTRLLANFDDLLDASWGPYTKPDPTDNKATVEATDKATGQKQTLSQKSAVRIVAKAYGLEDPEGELARIEEEQKEAQAKAAEIAAAAPKPELPEGKPNENMPGVQGNGRGQPANVP